MEGPVLKIKPSDVFDPIRIDDLLGFSVNRRVYIRSKDDRLSFQIKSVDGFDL
jgi:hypothetical protein